MPFLEAWLVENCIIAALLAVAVLVLSHVCRPRPAMEHLLWAAVLLKFVMPPLTLWPAAWQTPVPVWLAPSLAAVNGDPPKPVPSVDGASETFFFAPSNSDGQSTPPVAQMPLSVSVPQDVAGASTQPAAIQLRHPLAVAWLISILLAASFQMRRWRKFQRGLSGTEPASGALLAEVKAVAQSLNCRLPRVLISELGATPLVWGVWKPTLLWPKCLNGRLNSVARQSVLLHELIHLRRRDHWTAWLDLTAGCLWWWHPACWLARARLREAAELACDAEVLHRRPDAGHEYATALVTVCELMSRSARPALTVGAASPARRFFTRRLNMILSKRLLVGIPLWFTGVLAGVLLMLLPKLPPLTYQQPQFFDADVVVANAEPPRIADYTTEVTLANERRGERATNQPATKKAAPNVEEVSGLRVLVPAVGPSPATDEAFAFPVAQPGVPSAIPSPQLPPESVDPFDEPAPPVPVKRNSGPSLLQIDPALQTIEIQYHAAAPVPTEKVTPMGILPVPVPAQPTFDLTWGKTRLRCLKVEHRHVGRGPDHSAVIQAGNNELQIQAPGVKLGGMTKLSLNLQELRIEPARIDALLKAEVRISYATMPSPTPTEPVVPVALIQWGELTLYVTEAEFAHGAHANDPVKMYATEDKISLIRKDLQLQAKQIILKPDSVTVGGAAVLENKTLPPAPNKTSFDDFGEDNELLPRRT